MPFVGYAYAHMHINILISVDCYMNTHTHLHTRSLAEADSLYILMKNDAPMHKFCPICGGASYERWIGGLSLAGENRMQHPSVVFGATAHVLSTRGPAYHRYTFNKYTHT